MALSRSSYTTIEDRFWHNIVLQPDGCWSYAENKISGGYGRIKAPGKEHGFVYADIYSYELACGPIPDDHGLDHTCGNTCCVNPAHLIPARLPKCGRLPRKQKSAQEIALAVQELVAPPKSPSPWQQSAGLNLYSTKKITGSDDRPEPKTPIRSRMSEAERRKSVKSLQPPQMRNLIFYGYGVPCEEVIDPKALTDLLIEVEFHRDEGNV